MGNMLKFKKTLWAFVLAAFLGGGYTVAPEPIQRGITSFVPFWKYSPVVAGPSTCAHCFFETSFSTDDAAGWSGDVYDDICGAGYAGIQSGVAEGGDDLVDGNCTGIISAANHAAGRGGLGERFWFGDTLNEVSGAVVINFTDTSLAANACASSPCTLWMRWYVRYASGMAIASSSGHKTVYFSGSRCAGGGGCYWLFGSPGGAEASRVTRAGVNFLSDDTPTQGFDDVIGGGSNSSDGLWHCFEYQMTMESDGTATDGIARWWVDDTLIFDNDALDWNTAGTGWSGFELPQNGIFTPGSGTNDPIDYDDIALSVTQRVGCF